MFFLALTQLLTIAKIFSFISLFLIVFLFFEILISCIKVHFLQQKTFDKQQLKSRKILINI